MFQNCSVNVNLTSLCLYQTIQDGASASFSEQEKRMPENNNENDEDEEMITMFSPMNSGQIVEFFGCSGDQIYWLKLRLKADTVISEECRALFPSSCLKMGKINAMTVSKPHGAIYFVCSDGKLGKVSLPNSSSNNSLRPSFTSFTSLTEDKAFSLEDIAVSVGSRGKYVAVAGSDGKVYLLDEKGNGKGNENENENENGNENEKGNENGNENGETTLKVISSSDKDDMPLTRIAFLTETEFLVGTLNGVLKLYNVSDISRPTAILVESAEMEISPVSSIRVHPLQPFRVIVGHGNGRVALWNLQDPLQPIAESRSVHDPSSAVRDIQFLPDKPFMAVSCADDGALCVFPAASSGSNGESLNNSSEYFYDRNSIFPSFGLNSLVLVPNIRNISRTFLFVTGESGILHYSSSFLSQLST